MKRQPDDPGIDFTDRPAPKAGFVDKAVILIVFLFALLSSCVTRAHDWYPVECCSGRDCSPISERAVREVQGGFLVTIIPGSHPMWGPEKTEPLQLMIPYRQMKMSPDGQWHVCISPVGNLLCFFGVVGGF